MEPALCLWRSAPLAEATVRRGRHRSCEAVSNTCRCEASAAEGEHAGLASPRKLPRVKGAHNKEVIEAIDDGVDVEHRLPLLAQHIEAHVAFEVNVRVVHLGLA